MIPKNQSTLVLSFFAPMVFCVFATPLAAKAETLCTSAAKFAAEATGAPLNVLNAIMEHESSGHPWILNIDTQPRRYQTPQETVAAAKQALAAGARNVDVGCFQVSTRHHRAGFRSLGEMASPIRNAVYAALFLLDLKRQKGDWASAIACYHSCEPSRGAQYLRAVADKMR